MRIANESADHLDRPASKQARPRGDQLELAREQSATRPNVILLASEPYRAGHAIMEPDVGVRSPAVPCKIEACVDHHAVEIAACGLGRNVPSARGVVEGFVALPLSRRPCC